MKKKEEPKLDLYEENYRICTYCGDSFIAHHGLQQFCPEKLGRANYCKYKQKALLSQRRLADLAIELAKANLTVAEETPLNKNIQVIEEIIGNGREITTTSDVLDSKGYRMEFYSSRISIDKSNSFLVNVGNYILEWIEQSGSLATFKITRS